MKLIKQNHKHLAWAVKQCDLCGHFILCFVKSMSETLGSSPIVSVLILQTLAIVKDIVLNVIVVFMIWWVTFEKATVSPVVRNIRCGQCRRKAWVTQMKLTSVFGLLTAAVQTLTHLLRLPGNHSLPQLVYIKQVPKLQEWKGLNIVMRRGLWFELVYSLLRNTKYDSPYYLPVVGLILLKNFCAYWLQLYIG